jgi:hypothetical protein
MSEEIKEFAPVVDMPQASQPVAKFDPTKKYIWSSDVNFTLSGSDFGLLLNALRSITSTKEAQTILRAAEAGDVLENILAHAVETGVVIEAPEAPKNSL